MTIDDLIDELARAEEEARALAALLTDAQGNWQPDGGTRWSVVQNLQHLARTNEVYVDALREGLRRARRTGAGPEDLFAIPGWFGRWFIRSMEPPPRFRVRTRPIVQPPSTGTLADSLAAFLASHDLVRAFIRETSGRDLRARFKSPFGPVRFAVATGLLVVAAHDRRHLWQARQVTQAPGFPRS